MKKILIPVVQKLEEREIIDEAVKIAKTFGSKLILFNVDNRKEVVRNVETGEFMNIDKVYDSYNRIQDPYALGKMNKMNEIKYETIKDTSFLEQIKRMYEAKGVNVEIIIQEKDDPASAIIDEAEKGNYDLVIMKSQTLKKRKRFMLGSVTNKVVHHIKVPILVVR